MSFVGGLILAAWFALLPVGFLTRAVSGWRRDRLTATVHLVAGFGHVANTAASWIVGAANSTSPGSPGAVAQSGVLAFGLLAFAFGLWRDRRLGHIRSTPESLAILGIGGAYLLILLGLPSL